MNTLLRKTHYVRSRAKRAQVTCVSVCNVAMPEGSAWRFRRSRHIQRGFRRLFSMHAFCLFVLDLWDDVGQQFLLGMLRLIAGVLNSPMLMYEFYYHFNNLRFIIVCLTQVVTCLFQVTF